MDAHTEAWMEQHRLRTRRHFLSSCAGGLGAAAASLLFQGRAAAAMAPADLPHFAPRAKRVIYIHLAGSPPQQDLFDYKPKLNELNGQPCPDSLMEKERFAFIKGHPKILGTPYQFKQHGQAGTWVSELLPHFSEIVDDVTVVRSMYTDQFNHAPAQLFLHTGAPRPGRPSMGSWACYGLGSENHDLPGFMVLVSSNTPDAGKSVFGSGFLPSVYQGVQCRTQGDPVLYVSDPSGMDRTVRRRSLDALRSLNEQHLAVAGDPEIATRIAQYELAFRMQISVPEVMDIASEPEHIRTMYGAEPGASSFANNCLLARRLAERGVRFTQLFDWGWDTHGTSPGDDIVTHLPKKCQMMDRPVAALIKDLKQRGMLEDTLVIWSGEFGRTAMNEERDGSKYLGRDHHPHSFTIWMAGGGVKRGGNVGATDELGYRAVEEPVHIHDLQATILHLLGLDHEQLTFRFQGRDFRLTDVHGKIVPALIA
ncbi:MAG TPA: DUF1501 domain-containing protein [Candidatus Hydrogenedentes bacterium]|nr:DUF1501 domain-containing protein [Candidatus Hydrogenedentota bacterium]HRK34776.1 DUF1501 domain-containing protein [Candidatus Hydrogenedentota bacterium]